MIKNNINSLIIHICICVILYIFFGDLSREHIMEFSLYKFIINLSAFLFIAILYFLFGYLVIGRFSKTHIGRVKRFLSVSSVCFIGLLIWIPVKISEIIVYVYSSGNVNHFWVLYNAYIIPCRPLQNLIKMIAGNINNDYLVLLPFLLTIIIWLGYEYKINNKKSIEKVTNTA